MSGVRPPAARAEIARARAITPASTEPICVALVANTATSSATLVTEFPPPHINGTLAVTRTDRRLWYWNNAWMKASI